MGIIWALLIGLVVGGIAKLLMPGRDPGGFLITMLLGVAGSVVANLIGSAAGWYGPNEGAGFVASIIGAILVLVGYRAVVRNRA